MQEPAKKRDIAWMTIAKGIAVLAVFGVLSYTMEHWGGKYMSRVSDFVADQDVLGQWFCHTQCIATCVCAADSVYRHCRGSVRMEFGTVYASVAMTTGATAAFS